MASWWRALLTAGMIGMGVIGYWKGKQLTAMAAPAVATVVGHAMLFLIYGHHFFLYGLHWAFSLTWLIAGLAFLPPRHRPYSIGLLSLFVVLAASDSLQLATRLLDRLWTA